MQDYKIQIDNPAQQTRHQQEFQIDVGMESICWAQNFEYVAYIPDFIKCILKNPEAPQNLPCYLASLNQNFQNVRFGSNMLNLNFSF